ncbi:MAG: isocitrate/isopropylmalate dehydrogenase family protein [Dehalococcoidia bacterium]
MAYNVTLIPGDGTGPEITEATRRVLEATGVQFDWDIQEAGVDIMKTTGTPLPPSVLASIRKNKVALKGPITTPIGAGFCGVNVALRKELDLYACLRPCKSYAGVRSRCNNIDLIIVRENTDDLYAGIEFEKGDPPIAELSQRIVKFAFDYAREYKRRKVSAVTKANIMKYSDGLFLEVAREVAKGYSDIEYEEVLVDNMSMQLVQKAELYDILVLPNLYGNVLSDLCAGLVGGLGVAPGANIGEDTSLFEPTHGSAPKYTGMNKMNPIAMMLSGVLMLHHLNEHDAANRLEKAIADVIAEGKTVTYDMKPDRNDPSAVGTSQVADGIIAKLKGK